jgi:hypothetical protein
MRRWPQKSILGMLAGWYLLVNCLVPLFHHHSKGNAACPRLGSEPGHCHTTHLSHNAHEPHVAATNLSQMSRLTNTREGHSCLFCTYLSQLQTFKRLRSGAWTLILPCSQPMIPCTNMDHFMSSPWTTSIILRGPPLGQYWDTWPA